MSDRLPKAAPPVAPDVLTPHAGGLYVVCFAAEDLCNPGGPVRLEGPSLIADAAAVTKPTP